jgi:predicted transcriptional regulator
MHEQRIEDVRFQEERFTERNHEKAVLHLLLSDGLPWTVKEIVREVSADRLDAIDAIARLAGAGLVHRVGEFVFPTRTARRADEIDNS